MSKLLDQAPEGRFRFIQERWRRIGRASQDAQLRNQRQAQSQARTNVGWRAIARRPVVNWRKMITVASALAGVGLSSNFAIAWLKAPSAQDLVQGQELFAHKWTPNDPLSHEGDGLGPVFNAASCAECHYQGGIGGGGDLRNNVASFEVLPTLHHPDPTGGVIHAQTIIPGCEESFQTVRAAFPIIPGGVTLTAVCQVPLTRDYDPVVPHSINTPTLFGAGQIDQISPLAIQAEHTRKILNGVKQELASNFSQIGHGRVRVLPDGRIGKFGWKAQFATLEEFVANACAVEVGLTTPTSRQHKPQAHQEDETAKLDLNRKQFGQLVAYVASLPAPQLLRSQDPQRQASVETGQELFSAVGCAECHTPNLGGATGVYSDFLLHDLTDPQASSYNINPEVPVPGNHPKASEWKTPPLWGVAQTAPYLHDGSAATLQDAIEAHRGQARHALKLYQALSPAEQAQLLDFLGSLAVPDEVNSTTQL